MSVHHVFAAPTEARRGHQILWSGIMDGCELLYGCWELNLGFLEEQPVLLISELSLQPQQIKFVWRGFVFCFKLPCRNYGKDFFFFVQGIKSGGALSEE